MLGVKQERSGASMPKGPRGEKRPADVIGNAVHVMKIATRELRTPDDGKDQAAKALGNKGGAALTSGIVSSTSAMSGHSAVW